MKKALLWVLVLGLAFGVLACTTEGGLVKGKTYKTEKWVDNDTFRVYTVGVAKEGVPTKTQRQITAREAALIAAQKMILEKFKNIRMEGASGSVDGASTGIAISKEFGGLVRGGSIVSETYDPETDDCGIWYEIKAPGLKKKVKGGAE